jgi:hypothetical protein
VVKEMGQPREGCLPLLMDAGGVSLGEGFEGLNLLIGLALIPSFLGPFCRQ